MYSVFETPVFAVAEKKKKSQKALLYFEDFTSFQSISSYKPPSDRSHNQTPASPGGVAVFAAALCRVSVAFKYPLQSTSSI